MTVWDVVKQIRKSKDRHIAAMLEELEQVLDDDRDRIKYGFVRKIVLDHFNDFYRTAFKMLLGIEIEGQKDL